MCDLNNLENLPVLLLRGAKENLFSESIQDLRFSQQGHRVLMQRAMEPGPRVEALEREQIVGESWRMTCYIVALLFPDFFFWWRWLWTPWTFGRTCRQRSTWSVCQCINPNTWTSEASACSTKLSEILGGDLTRQNLGTAQEGMTILQCIMGGSALAELVKQWVFLQW